MTPPRDGIVLDDARVIAPGSTIGCLGGGQLGRMMAFAARSMGYDVKALDPDPACAIRDVASRVVTAKFDDVEAALSLAGECDVMTLEIEQIAPRVLEAVAATIPLRPAMQPVYIVQDRLRQKRFLRDRGFPVGPFAEASDARSLGDACREMGRVIAKATSGGYDGRGQARLDATGDAEAAWTALGARTCIAEQMLDLDYEISVLVARTTSGETIAYEPSRNHHTNGILTWAVTPAEIDAEIAVHAKALAVGIAEALGIVGLLAVECFVTREGALLVNELAPRPHNTYHHADRAFATSQFEQLVRCVCNLPLGSAALVTPTAIVNILGDIWVNGREPEFDAALATDTVRLHLYGKAGARAGRKMGHLSAVGATAQQAVDRVLTAYRAVAPQVRADFDVTRPTLPAPSTLDLSLPRA